MVTAAPTHVWILGTADTKNIIKLKRKKNLIVNVYKSLNLINTFKRINIWIVSHKNRFCEVWLVLRVAVCYFLFFWFKVHWNYSTCDTIVKFNGISSWPLNSPNLHGRNARAEIFFGLLSHRQYSRHLKGTKLASN